MFTWCPSGAARVSPALPRAWVLVGLPHHRLLFQLENLRASYTELQAQSQEEIRRLGAQLESARSSRQEPSGEEPRVQNPGSQRLGLSSPC